MPPTIAGRTLRVALVVLFAAAAGCSARGQGGPPGFDQADRNHDDVIDPAEWDQAGSRVFDRIDADGDGLASPQEFHQSFDGIDSNHDGTIDGGESPLVVILGDSDGDDRVDPSEFQAIDWTRKSIDTDGDGAVSRDEFRDANQQIYDRADYDRSLTLNRSEYQGAPSLTLFKF